MNAYIIDEGATEGGKVNESRTTSSGQPVNGTDEDKTGNNNTKILIGFGVAGLFISLLCMYPRKFFYL